MRAQHWPTLEQIGLLRKSAASGDLLVDGTLVVRRWLGEGAAAKLDWVDPIDGRSLGVPSPTALAACALDADRVLWIGEDRALRSRAARGGDERLHGRITLAASGGARWMAAGEGIAVIVELDDEDGSRTRVSAIELEGGATRWTAPFAWVSMVSVEGGFVWLLDRDIDDDRRATLVCVDPRTGASRWIWRFESTGDRDVEQSGPIAWIARDRVVGGSVVAIDAVRGDLHWWLDEGRVVGRAGRRVLVERAWRSLDVRSLKNGALRARFALQDRVRRTCAIDERRVALTTRDTLWVIDVVAGTILAAEHIGAIGSKYPRLDASGALIVHEPRERWLGDPRVIRGSQLRVASTRDAERAQWIEPFDEAEPAFVELSVDAERLAHIALVLREESGDREAAWERLHAQGVIDPRFDRQRWALFAQGDAARAGSIEAWCALAHDSALLCDALALCDELRHALRPWLGALGERVSLDLDGFESWRSQSQLARWMLSALSEIVDAPWPEPDARAALAVCDAAWRRAADEGLVFADTAPSMLANASVSERRSPAAPWLALCALGLAPAFVGDELRLSYVAMNEALDGRAVFDDVPF